MRWPHRRRAGPGAALAALGVVLAAPAAALDVTAVHLRSGTPAQPTVGQGLLFAWRDGCYALTALHVLGGADRAALAAGSNRQALGQALLVQRFEPDDLALLRVNGDAAREPYCTVALDTLAYGTERLNRGDGTGLLPYVDAEGQVTQSRVLFRTLREDVLFLQPLDPRSPVDRFFPGRSGGLVSRSDGTPAGVVIRLDDNNGGGGQAVAIDRAVRLVRAHFERPLPAGLPAAVPPPPDPTGNLLDASRGAQVLKWSTPSRDAATGPERVLDAASAAPPWVARLDPRGAPVELLLQFAPQATAPVLARVEIDLPPGEPAARWASELSLSVSSTGEPGSWRGFGGTAVLHEDEARKIVLSTPTQARYLRVLVARNRGDDAYVTLARVRAYAR